MYIHINNIGDVGLVSFHSRISSSDSSTVFLGFKLWWALERCLATNYTNEVEDEFDPVVIGRSSTLAVLKVIATVVTVTVAAVVVVIVSQSRLICWN